ncbi:MAG: hypothetical protein KBG29_08165 [Pseudomonadales bacterium]|nr:hypothetical protein [Pseudomonadales bacterium]MBP9033855.1 hypothetical protein [Pseudomonadales bacterium]
MRWRTPLALLAAAFATGVLAQDAPEQAPQAPATSAAPAREPATDARQAPPSPAASDERFVPSEDISEDLSVSFPSDI